MSKMPAFQFYPGDWRKDPNLSRASLAAKGAMIEIMCLAFECEKRGVLKTGSTPWTIQEIAMAIGGDTEINKSAIQELLDKKILKKDRKNAIFSSRMCKDEKIRKVRREAGLKGGNPNLLNQNVNQKTTPSSSSSSSTTVINTDAATPENCFLKLDQRGKDIFEMFRRNLDRREYPDTAVIVEVNKFQNKYPGIMVKNSGGLVNTWCGNIGKQNTVIPGQVINNFTKQKIYC